MRLVLLVYPREGEKTITRDQTYFGTFLENTYKFSKNKQVSDSTGPIPEEK